MVKIYDFKTGKVLKDEGNNKNEKMGHSGEDLKEVKVAKVFLEGELEYLCRYSGSFEDFAYLISENDLYYTDQVLFFTDKVISVEEWTENYYLSLMLKEVKEEEDENE